MATPHADLIQEALSQKYEKRTYQQHQTLTNLLAPLFPTLNAKKIKLLTFFLQIRVPPTEILPEQYTPNSIVITLTPTANPELPSISMLKLGKQAISVAPFGFAVVIDYEKYLNADRLGETSIEKQISFWESSQYFCSMPKVKFYELIRLAKVMAFSQGQGPYVQGQLVTESQSGSGIYVIRRGQFGCYRTDGKEVEASHFDSGHMFGALELIGQGRSKYRVTTMRCKTSEAVVYQFSQTVFNQYMRHYCEHVIRTRQAKLMRFLPPPEFMEKSKSLSFSHTVKQPKILHSDTASSLPFRSASTQADREMQETQHRAFPALRLEKIRQTATTSFYKNTLRESERIEAEGLRRSTYLSLKQEGPLKNYPLPVHSFLTSEFRDLGKLLIGKGEVGKSEGVSVGRSDRGVWKRDMMSSLYRQSMFGSLRRHPE